MPCTAGEDLGLKGMPQVVGLSWKDKVPLCLLPWASTVHARWTGWLIFSLLRLVFDLSSWITPDLLILWLREQQLAPGRDQDRVAGGGEGEAAAKRASVTHVCWVKTIPEWLSKTSSVFAPLI